MELLESRSSGMGSSDVVIDALELGNSIARWGNCRQPPAAADRPHPAGRGWVLCRRAGEDLLPDLVVHRLVVDVPHLLASARISRLPALCGDTTPMPGYGGFTSKRSACKCSWINIGDLLDDLLFTVLMILPQSF